MKDRDTPQNAVEKPSGPKKRQSLFEIRRNRRNDQGDTMSKKDSRKTCSNRSPANAALKTQTRNSSSSSPGSQSSQSSRSNENSPIGNEETVEFPRYRGGSMSPSLYPEIDEIREINDKLHSYRSIRSEHIYRSTNTSSSSIGSETWNDGSYKKYTPESKKSPKQNKDEQSNTFMLMIIIVPIILFVVYCSFPHSQQSDAKIESDVFHDVFDDVNSRINDVAKLFPSQNEDIWSYFTAGIREVKNKVHRPAVFLLLASDDDTTAICLAKKIAEVTRSTLGGTGDAILRPDELENQIDTVFKLITERVTRTKTVIFLDVLSIQPEALRAFHDICDPDYSLVEEAVYLIIMKSELYSESEHLVAFAERQLNNSFSSDIREDILRALITRITAGAVLPIRTEKNLPCSKYDVS